MNKIIIVGGNMHSRRCSAKYRVMHVSLDGRSIRTWRVTTASLRSQLFPASRHDDVTDHVTVTSQCQQQQDQSAGAARHYRLGPALSRGASVGRRRTSGQQFQQQRRVTRREIATTLRCDVVGTNKQITELPMAQVTGHKMW